MKTIMRQRIHKMQAVLMLMLANLMKNLVLLEGYMLMKMKLMELTLMKKMVLLEEWMLMTRGLMELMLIPHGFINSMKSKKVTQVKLKQNILIVLNWGKIY